MSTPYGDPVTAPFWEAAARHELLVQECNACGNRQFAPRRLCLACASDDVGWIPCAGAAVVHARRGVRTWAHGRRTTRR